MKDSSHGSAYLLSGKEDAHRACHQPLLQSRSHVAGSRPPSYRGCSPTRRRRGVIRTRPKPAHRRRRRARSSTTAAEPLAWETAGDSRVLLELPDDAYIGVPCWGGTSGRWACWAHVTAALAYDLHYQQIRPLMCDGGISREAFILVAAAMGRHADYRTGRNSRASNTRLAALAGVSVRVVQRGKEALRLLGLATEVLRGRQRTKAERMASWRVGDRGRGWASVWALHDNPWLNRLIQSVSPHPAGSSFTPKPPVWSVVTTHSRRPTGAGRRGARRRYSPDKAGAALARAWRAHRNVPRWALRHSADAWAAVLAAPARHGWTARDLNQLITDWLVSGRAIPNNPYKPIGLLGAILGWHGDLEDRPAALDEAREAAELADARARQAAAAAERAQAQRDRRAAAASAAAGTGRAEFRAEAARLAKRAAQRRTHAAAREAAAREQALRRARGHRDRTEGP